MNIVQFNNVNKSYLDENLLKDITFSIQNDDRIGLIGLNGVGKTSIIKLILGLEKQTSGDIFVNKNIHIGHISQNHTFENDNNTVKEELKTVFKDRISMYKRIQELNSLVLIDNKYQKELDELNEKFSYNFDIDYRVNQVINGLDLTNIQNSSIYNLSGGEKTRLSIAKLILEEPDLLILDEPTNHLDLSSIEWLEEFLKKYKKAFLLISHDRIFLDNVCNRIFEIENKKLYKYKGNFSDFIIQKELILKGEIKAYDKEQERIKKLEEYIERNRAGRMAKQSKGRQKLLDRMEKSDNPIFNAKKMKLKFNINRQSAENVLSVNNIYKNFDDKNILNDISFKIYKGDKIGIIGKNGCGKSTLLKIISNKLNYDSGSINLGVNVDLAYFDQKLENLNPNNSILQEINTSINYTNEYLRSLSASFLFSNESVDKKILELSGGEKVRLSLLKLIQKNANFLILDEPTNHLDIYSIEVLEDALEAFEGSLLLVSHNRHFLDAVCNSIYVLDEKGLSYFKGNYMDYKNSLKTVKIKDKDEVSKNTYLEQKEKNKQIKKLEKSIENIEKRLDEIDEERKQNNELMFDNKISSNIEKLMLIQNTLDNLDNEELELTENWDRYNEELNLLKNF